LISVKKFDLLTQLRFIFARWFARRWCFFLSWVFLCCQPDLDLPFWQFNLQEDDASFCPDSFCFMILCCQIDLAFRFGKLCCLT
jgi:hypothetical protein